MKPRLHKHVTLRVESPDDDGEDTLVFTSARRRIAMKGRSFQDFAALVVPLLQGSLTLTEIQARVAHTFAPRDVAECIALLERHNLVDDAETEAAGLDRAEERGPLFGYFREMGQAPEHAQQRLRDASVTVVGVGALGAVAALSLAATGIGRIRCIDRQMVLPSDPFLAQTFTRADVGRRRTDVVTERIAAINSNTVVEAIDDALQSDDDFISALRGTDVALGSVDPALSSLSYKLNRASLVTGVPCCFGEVSGFEGVVGPTVLPSKTACYLCYQMRIVACAEDPEDAFAALKHLDRRHSDDSPVRENLAFCSGVVGNLVALEAFKFLIGGQSSTVGQVTVIDFVRGGSTRHVVLRKPWCPACFQSPSADSPTPSI